MVCLVGWFCRLYCFLENENELGITQREFRLSLVKDGPGYLVRQGTQRYEYGDVEMPNRLAVATFCAEYDLRPGSIGARGKPSYDSLVTGITIRTTEHWSRDRVHLGLVAESDKPIVLDCRPMGTGG